jgi:hypothetical protein
MARATEELSVIICWHNPRSDYLRRVLDALQSQELPKHRWELLLVDNASARRLSLEWDLSWHPSARHVFESELGLSAARLRGVRESNANVILFVDDDNLLAPDYLSRVLQIGVEWPRLGTWGSGAIIPEFEVQPPESTKQFFPLLALRQSPVPRWGNVIGVEATPWGAGLCVRRPVAIAYCRHCEITPIRITGRHGKLLLSGEDIEMSEVACGMGLGTDVFPELKLAHIIPKERISTEYLLRVFEGSTYKCSGTVPRYPFSPRGWLSIAKTLMIKLSLASLRAIIQAHHVIKSDKATNQTFAHGTTQNRLKIEAPC